MKYIITPPGLAGFNVAMKIAAAASRMDALAKIVHVRDASPYYVGPFKYAGLTWLFRSLPALPPGKMRFCLELTDNARRIYRTRLRRNSAILRRLRFP